MIGRIDLRPPDRWAELYTDARPAPGERVGGIVLGTIRASGDATGRDRGLMLEILGRTIELESGSARPGETHAFRIGEEGGRVFLEPLAAAEAGDAIDAALRHLGRLPDPRGRELVQALLGQGLPVTAEALAALDRAVAIAAGDPGAAARAGALLLSAGIEITPRMLAAAILLLAPWPEVSARLQTAAAHLGVEGLAGLGPEDALDAIVRLVAARASHGALPEEVARAARDWIAFLDARWISSAQALFSLPTPAGFAPTRILFEDPRRAAKRRAAHRFVVDVALPALGRVWGEVVLEGRAGRARFRAERPRMRRALAKGLPDLVARVAEQGIAIAGKVEPGPPPAPAVGESPAPPPVAGLDVQA